MGIIADNMNHVYVDLVRSLIEMPERVSISRKGATLFEHLYYEFTLTDIHKCIPFVRPDYSEEYLQKEFEFYCKGSNKLVDALELSKAWGKCSDDGETITSNYGKLLFHDRNSHGLTQFEYARAALVNNLDTKKAVMVIHSAEHAHISNDNPCTMFLHFVVTADNVLNMKTHMRSNDVWFGLVYDVPFFCAVQYAMWRVLKEHHPDLKLGVYKHYACSLHMYEKDREALAGLLSWYNSPWKKDLSYSHHQQDVQQALFQRVLETVSKRPVRKEMSCGMAAAWDAASKSLCLKKKCGAALMWENPDLPGGPVLISTGFGGKETNDIVSPCEVCNRDTKQEEFFGDGCWSVHAEMRAFFNFINDPMSPVVLNKDHLVMYVTHGPCDACLKFLDYVGVHKVVYDVPYKTNYAHWPRMSVTREAVTPAEIEKGKSSDVAALSCAWSQPSMEKAVLAKIREKHNRPKESKEQSNVEDKTCKTCSETKNELPFCSRNSVVMEVSPNFSCEKWTARNKPESHGGVEEISVLTENKTKSPS